MVQRSALAFVLVVAVGTVVAPSALRADFYDDFEDGEYLEPFPPFDIDDPCWIIYEPLGGPYTVGALDGYLQLWTTPYFVPQCALMAYPNSGDTDPNTSETWWGGGLNHYVMARTKNMDPQADPNDDGGESMLLLHANVVQWVGFGFEYPYRKYSGGRVLPRISSIQGLEWPIYKRGVFEPDDPCHPDEVNGFWMLFAYQTDGTAGPNDPNGKSLCGAFWNGDKFDWNGDWFLEADLGDANTWREQTILDGDWWQAEGITVVGTGEYVGTSAFVGFDEIEARTGDFDPNAKQLQLTVSHPENGYVTVEPETEMMRDPNDPFDPNTFDPNDPNTYPEERTWRYTPGTEVMLMANAWPGGKGFNKWEVTDPADANNSFSDTNTVMYLTMDREWEVKAKFACGSAALMPMIGLTLLALGVGVVLRRFS